MSTYHTDITITNNSDDTLTLDYGASNGIDTGAWPYQVNPHATAGPFSQGWNFQLKFTAVFVNQASTNPQKPTLDLYAYCTADGWHSLQINQTPNNPPPYPHSYTTRNGRQTAQFTIG